eukprot:1055382-Pelagomonas_calceolata.AAC.9
MEKITRCLQGTSMPEDDINSFIQEAALTRKLKHKYIVGYVGIGERTGCKQMVTTQHAHRRSSRAGGIFIL